MNILVLFFFTCLSFCFWIFVWITSLFYDFFFYRKRMKLIRVIECSATDCSGFLIQPIDILHIAYFIYTTMYAFLLHSCNYLWKLSIIGNVATDEINGGNKIWTLNKRWNWSTCELLALSESRKPKDQSNSWTHWTHKVKAQTDRAVERNSVVVGSNPTGSNFL